MNPFREASGNESISEGRDIPWLQDVDADGDGTPETIVPGDFEGPVQPGQHVIPGDLGAGGTGTGTGAGVGAG